MSEEDIEARIKDICARHLERVAALNEEHFRRREAFEAKSLRRQLAILGAYTLAVAIAIAWEAT